MSSVTPTLIEQNLVAIYSYIFKIQIKPESVVEIQMIPLNLVIWIYIYIYKEKQEEWILCRTHCYKTTIRALVKCSVY